MDSINLSDYYSKISQIRARILSKHKENKQPRLAYADVKNQNVKNAIVLQQRSNLGSQRKGVLEEKTQNKQYVVDRVKMLDSVNDKIKTILANKRATSTNYQANKVQKESPAKKLASFYPNQYEFGQIKVNQPLTLQSKGTNKYENEFISLNLNHKFSIEQKMAKEDPPISKRIQRYKAKQDQRKVYIKQSERLPKQSILYKQSPQIYNTFHNTKPLSINPQQLQTNKQQTQKLIKLLQKQIQLDITLNQYKQKFENFRNQNKLQTLKQTITKIIQISDNQLLSWITLASEQCNPFLELSFDQSFDFEGFGNCIAKSKKHWQNQLRESVSISKLESQSFSIKQIDLGEKGYLIMEDFVCFININSNTCLRNRDVFSLFKRLSLLQNKQFSNKIRYESFLNYMTY